MTRVAPYATLVLAAGEGQKRERMDRFTTHTLQQLVLIMSNVPRKRLTPGSSPSRWRGVDAAVDGVRSSARQLNLLKTVLNSVEEEALRSSLVTLITRRKQLDILWYRTFASRCACGRGGAM